MSDGKVGGHDGSTLNTTNLCITSRHTRPTWGDDMKIMSPIAMTPTWNPIVPMYAKLTYEEEIIHPNTLVKPKESTMWLEPLASTKDI